MSISNVIRHMQIVLMLIVIGSYGSVNAEIENTEKISGLSSRFELRQFSETNLALMSFAVVLQENIYNIHPQEMTVESVRIVKGETEIVGSEILNGTRIDYHITESKKDNIDSIKVSIKGRDDTPQPELRITLQQNNTVSSPELFGLASMYSFLNTIIVDDSGQFDRNGYLQEKEQLCSTCWAGYRTLHRAFLLSGTSLDIKDSQVSTSDVIPSIVLTQTMQKEASNGVISFSNTLKIFNNPVEYNSLIATDNTALMQLMYSHLWDWVRSIVFGLRALVYFLFSLVGNWGGATILLALCIRIIIYPVSELAAKYQKEAISNQQLLKPFIADIKRQYKGEEQSEKLFALYEKYNIHPLSGFKSFFGLALQIPIFIAVFALLGELQPLVGASFLWINDLSLPDAIFGLPFAVPLLGDQFNLMPFIMVLVTLISANSFKDQTMTKDAIESQKKQTYYMALLFFFLFYTFPAALVLYWTSSIFFQMLQQFVTQHIVQETR